MGEQFLPELGYEKRVHVMNELLPSLTGGKMSSSHPPHTKIMFLDDAAVVEKKIAGASCPAGAVAGNGVLPIIQHILIPVSEIRMLNLDGGKTNGVNGHVSNKVGPFAAKGAPEGTLFSVAMPAASCDSNLHRHYCNYEQVERDWVAGLLEVGLLKDAVASALNQMLQRMRDLYEDDDEWKQTDRMGYPEDWPRQD